MEPPNLSDVVRERIVNRGVSAGGSSDYKRLGLSFNPFPRSGISDLNSSDQLVLQLQPLEKEAEEKIDKFVVDSLFSDNPSSPHDRYLSMVIRGDYGYGKTQTLLYIKTYLESFNLVKDFHQSPYVIYIQNPGAQLTELVGSIIYQIGEENFRKYLWDQLIARFKEDSELKEEISELVKGGMPILHSETTPFSPFAEQNTVNYKKFWDACYTLAGKTKKKELETWLRSHTVGELGKILGDSYVANFFHDLLLESLGISKAWTSLVDGTDKNLHRREVYLINAIIKVILSQGYTHFYILVDEFEAVAEGRLSKSELDRYLANLRTLIDRERQWCSVFSMTNPAFEQVRRSAAPLAQRISGITLDLHPLNIATSEILVRNYLNLAREPSGDLTPFDQSAIGSLLALTKGVHRIFLKGCFTLIQRAREELKNGEVISSVFVERYIEPEYE